MLRLFLVVFVTAATVFCLNGCGREKASETRAQGQTEQVSEPAAPRPTQSPDRPRPKAVPGRTANEPTTTQPTDQQRESTTPVSSSPSASEETAAMEAADVIRTVLPRLEEYVSARQEPPDNPRAQVGAPFTVNHKEDTMIFEGEATLASPTEIRVFLRRTGNDNAVGASKLQVFVKGVTPRPVVAEANGQYLSAKIPKVTPPVEALLLFDVDNAQFWALVTIDRIIPSEKGAGPPTP